MTKKLLSSALILLTSLGHARGQAGVTGTNLGRVSDVPDAAIPGATVTIIDTATGLKHVLTTNNAGEYTAAELTTGPYGVKVQAPGFGARTENLAISVAQQARVDAQLTLGTAETLMNVNASAVTLDTETSSVSQLVSQKQVDSLPLNGRNFLNLLSIMRVRCRRLGNRGRCDKGKAMPSVSTAVVQSRITTPWMVCRTPTLL